MTLFLDFLIFAAFMVLLTVILVRVFADEESQERHAPIAREASPRRGPLPPPTGLRRA